jgi:hypothetical protein
MSGEGGKTEQLERTQGEARIACLAGRANNGG